MAYNTARGNTISCKNVRVARLRWVLLMTRIIGLCMLCRLSEAVVGEVDIGFCSVYHQEHCAAGIAVHPGIFVWTGSWDSYELVAVIFLALGSQVAACLAVQSGNLGRFCFLESVESCRCGHDVSPLCSSEACKLLHLQASAAVMMLLNANIFNMIAFDNIRIINNFYIN